LVDYHYFEAYMTDDKTKKLAEIKRHFGRRVMDHARLVIQTWQSLDDVLWNPDWHDEFVQHCVKLNKLASRYDLDALQESADRLIASLEHTQPNRPPNSELLQALSDNVHLLIEHSARRSDNEDERQALGGRKPVYVCFADQNLAVSLGEQLQFFGIPAQPIADADALRHVMHHRIPAALIVGTEFDGDGIAVAKSAQSLLSTPIPVLFQSADEPDIHMRLEASRAQAVYFQEGTLDIGLLVQELSKVYNFRAERPYRVLVVDDSRSQSLYTERTLNQAGMITRAVNDPMTVLEALQAFKPDAVLMDMYMPGCTGIEVARVIRQQPAYNALPILYLSAEQDIGKQMDAIDQGGDDFLTKPVASDVLIATVRHRCIRHRSLKDQMIRDSLTGLLDHNTILEALKQAISEAGQKQQPLCFVMIDIDHFKAVNDNYGHPVGDRIIRSLALYLRQRFRATDSVGRYGGEEFALVLPDTRIDDAERLLKEVCAGFALIDHDAGGKPLRTTFSGGVAQYREGMDVSDLNQAADQALYQAKRDGRNTIRKV
jgi:diguanylate cyclase (GGDEF)-like protein